MKLLAVASIILLNAYLLRNQPSKYTWFYAVGFATGVICGCIIFLKP